MITIPRSAKEKAAAEYYSGATDPIRIATQMLKAALPDLEEAVRKDLDAGSGKTGDWENITNSLCADLNRLGWWVIEETDEPAREYPICVGNKLSDAEARRYCRISRLKHWGLVNQVARGLYSITENGWMFLEGQYKVSKSRFILDDVALDEGGEYMVCPKKHQI